MTEDITNDPIDFATANPEVYKLMLGFGKLVAASELPRRLQELVKIRASQINKCAFCLNMHLRQAKDAGVPDDHIFLLNAWRDAPFYSPSERAALELTEAVTQISELGVSATLYTEVRAHFSESEYIWLVTVINTINSWNRYMIAFGVPPETS